MSVRVALVGAPQTGKSTLAGAIVPQIKCLHLDVQFCPEAGRDYILRTGEPEHVLEQVIMTHAAIEREDELLVHDYVVSDGASFMGDVYFSYMRHKAGRLSPDAKLDYAQAEIARVSRERLRSFQHIFYVPEQDFGVGKDPARIYIEDRHLLGRMMRAYLDVNLVDYHVVRSVGMGRRVREVMRVLEQAGAFPEEALARQPRTTRRRKAQPVVAEPSVEATS